MVHKSLFSKVQLAFYSFYLLSINLKATSYLYNLVDETLSIELQQGQIKDL